jgi:ubiquinone/menaquinone biosynthesis C-methylase UbiE
MSDQSQRFFDEAYKRLYFSFLTGEKTAQEVEGIRMLLNLSSGSSLLDIGCAWGRHAMLLARQVYQVTGLERSEALLRQAQDEAKTQDVQVRWIQEDMRQMPFEDEFDVALSLFSSFGYVEGEDENLQVLAQVYKSLKSGGILLLDILQQNRFVQSFTSYGVTAYEDGLIALEKRHFDLLSSRHEVEVMLLFPDGTRTSYNYSLRLYTLTEIVHRLAQVGFRILGCYGDLEGHACTLESRLVVVSQKRKMDVLKYKDLRDDSLHAGPFLFIRIASLLAFFSEWLFLSH